MFELLDEILKGDHSGEEATDSCTVFRCSCGDQYERYFTNLKHICIECGNIYYKQVIKPRVLKKVGRPRKRLMLNNVGDTPFCKHVEQPRFSVFPMISQHNDEYNDLLKFMNKKKLYLLHKTKVEMLFFKMFHISGNL